jgi:hypothetical protein
VTGGPCLPCERFVRLAPTLDLEPLMSQPTATLSPAVNQLAAFWSTQPDATKLIFNQLYREAPDLVLRVLTQGQLQPDPAHTAIDQIVAPAGDFAVLNQPGVSIYDVVIAPPFPKANEKFTARWTRSIKGPLPEHSDAVQIVDRDGQPVEERPESRAAVPADTQDTQTMTFDGLPTGTYTVSVWSNLEGNDGSGVPTAQGMRGTSGVSLYVGDTRDSQIVQTLPAAELITGGINDAHFAAEQLAGLTVDDDTTELDRKFRQGLAAAADALLTVDSLGDGFKNELRRVSDDLGRPIDWRPEIQDGSVAGVAQRLAGVAQISAAVEPGNVGAAILAIVGELY